MPQILYIIWVLSLVLTLFDVLFFFDVLMFVIYLFQISYQSVFKIPYATQWIRLKINKIMPPIAPKAPTSLPPLCIDSPITLIFHNHCEQLRVFLVCLRCWRPPSHPEFDIEVMKEVWQSFNGPILPGNTLKVRADMCPPTSHHISIKIGDSLHVNPRIDMLETQRPILMHKWIQKLLKLIW